MSDQNANISYKGEDFSREIRKRYLIDEDRVTSCTVIPFVCDIYKCSCDTDCWCFEEYGEDHVSETFDECESCPCSVTDQTQILSGTFLIRPVKLENRPNTEFRLNIYRVPDGFTADEETDDLDEIIRRDDVSFAFAFITDIDIICCETYLVYINNRSRDALKPFYIATGTWKEVYHKYQVDEECYDCEGSSTIVLENTYEDVFDEWFSQTVNDVTFSIYMYCYHNGNYAKSFECIDMNDKEICSTCF
jgi:hypothetical protein